MLLIIGKLFENNISKQLINYINDNIVDVYRRPYYKHSMNDIYFCYEYSRIQLLQLVLSHRISLIGITGDGFKIVILLIKDRTYSLRFMIVFQVRIFHYTGYNMDPYWVFTFYYIYFSFEIYNKTNTKY